MVISGIAVALLVNIYNYENNIRRWLTVTPMLLDGDYGSSKAA
jgi:hypothetical protein